MRISDWSSDVCSSDLQGPVLEAEDLPVVYVPGNHDEPLRDYSELQFGGITVLNEAIHVMADGRRFLVIHGDDFDGIVQYAKWLALLGDRAYVMMIWLNHWFNQADRKSTRLNSSH